MAKKNKGINIFRSVPKANLPRTSFNMSHQVKFSGEFGVAYPFFCQEVIPDDTWDIAVDHFARLSPMIAPVMHDLDVRFHWFFVPTRLVWEDFEDWITGGRTGTWREDNPDAFPVFNLKWATDFLRVADKDTTTAAIFNGSIFDFMGLNFGDQSLEIADFYNSQWVLNVLPFRAYWLIWNYFFRDQNIEDEVDIPMTSGLDVLAWMSNAGAHAGNGLFRVAWDKDYFTSATLTPQRGPQVYVPLGQNAPIINTQSASPFQNDLGTLSRGAGVSTGSSQDVGTAHLVVDYTGRGAGRLQVENEDGSLSRAVINSANYTFNTGQLEADLQAVPGTSIDDVRESFALQRFFERMQIVGSRFSEFLRGIFGTNAGDARLQMPEYLGSWQNPFMINNVSQTSSTTGISPQAGYAGNGMASQRNAPIRKNFPEHGYLIGLYVAMPRNGYFQGVDKKLLRTDWLDMFNPYFEHIGEQPVMESEIYFRPDIMPSNEPIFGYQSQYASYKFINSHIHGDFKSSLDFWTAARDFSSAPTLSENFIYYDKSEATDRLFVLENDPKFYVQCDVKAFATRSMSAYSTPKLL